MDLPKKTDDLNLIPYIILQVLTGQDEQKPGDDPHSQVGVRFAVGVYCDNMGEGKLNVLNIIERIRHRLLKREAGKCLRALSFRRFSRISLTLITWRIKIQDGLLTERRNFHA